MGDWKLIEFYELGDAELYNLANDPGEKHNMASESPDQFNEMRRQLRAWQIDLKAKMPQANPMFADQ